MTAGKALILLCPLSPQYQQCAWHCTAACSKTSDTLSTGDKLGNVLVDTAAAAADVLAWHSKTRGVGHSSSRGALRVWDLQRLHSYDKLQQQKQAQAHFPAGHCHLPCVL